MMIVGPQGAQENVSVARKYTQFRIASVIDDDWHRIVRARFFVVKFEMLAVEIRMGEGSAWQDGKEEINYDCEMGNAHITPKWNYVKELPSSCDNILPLLYTPLVFLVVCPAFTIDNYSEFYFLVDPN